MTRIRFRSRLAQSLGGVLLLLAAAIVASAPGAAQPSGGDRLPEFRQVSEADVSSSLRKIRRIRFAIDETMPPFAYRNDTGALTGFVPLVLQALCKDLKLSCEFITRSQQQALDSLAAAEVDAMLSLEGVEQADLAAFDFTRPFLRSFGRFASRVGSPLKGTTQRDLAGKRIGVRAGTRQQQFLEAYYSRSALVIFDSHAELYEALRTARIDIMFDDAFRLMFWLHGDDAKGCCAFLGHGYGIGTRLTRDVRFMVRKPDVDLRKVLDHGLDRLQSSGRMAGIYARFFPASPY